MTTEDLDATWRALVAERYGPQPQRRHRRRPTISQRDIGTLARRFILQRHRDPSGVSGTGVVAEGIEYTDGTVALRWYSYTPTTTIYDDLDAVEAIHGHGGATEVVWIDPDPAR